MCPQPSSSPGGVLSRYSELTWTLLGISYLVLLTAVCIVRLSPPAARDAGAPLNEFSAGRAIKHVEVIAAEPRPIGSDQHAKARQYILETLAEMGVSAEVQTATSASQARGGVVRAATVANIVARVPGTNNSKAVLISGHYDSVLNSPGASDDASAVGVMLETARAIKSTQPLRNDLILLFTDGEELGLLGARAFIEKHPWARDAGIVLNFEARGTSGPSIMFETSDGNDELVKQFAGVIVHPVASSLSYEIYKLLPNDTDVSVLKKDGLAALNFSNIQQVTHYHSSLDRPSNLDMSTLQHHGSVALALARHFGNIALDRIQLPAGNRVFFDLLSATLIHYPAAYALPISLLAVLGLGACLVIGIRKKRLTASGIAIGFGTLIASLIAVVLLVKVVWWVVLSIHDDYSTLLQGDTYNSSVYLLSFAALTAAVISALFSLVQKKANLESLWAGCLVLLALLGLLSSIYLAGGSYLLTWPLIAAVAGLALACLTPLRKKSSLRLAALLIVATPAVVLFAPMLYQIALAVTVSSAEMAAAIFILMLGFVLPVLNPLDGPKKWVPPAVLAGVSLALLVIGSSTSGFDRERPRPDHILYAVAGDTNQAYWATADRELDEFTGQFFDDSTVRGTITDIVPLSRGEFLKNEAPVANVSGPQLSLKEESVVDGRRTLRMLVTTGGPAYAVSIFTTSQIDEARVNGEPAGATVNGQWALMYCGPADGIDLQLKSGDTGPLKLTAVIYRVGLPNPDGTPLSPRPPHLIPSLRFPGDMTLVSKSFVF